MTVEQKALDGKRVAFTGRLASMTRVEAAALVKRHGGEYEGSVTRRTTLLVIGQEGWPLMKDGSISRKLTVARRYESLGHPLSIIPEEELLRRVGVADEGVHRHFNLAQLGKLLKVSRDRLRSWVRAGLIHPVDDVQGVSHFDFQQVTGVRTLCDLAAAGVSSDQVRHSLKQLARWLPQADRSLSQIGLLERNGRLLVRLDEGELSEPSGQLNFDFDAEGQTSIPATPEPTADYWKQQALALEESENLRDAEAAYRQALYLGGPSAELCFNLGNVLFGLGQLGQAAERYRQAVELDHEAVDAWNNLGNVLLELCQKDDAITAYRTALKLNPGYADAHYNLADALEQVSAFSESRSHWKEYLKAEPMGEWAEYARRRLALAK